jgi:uncharacterized protein (TIRG00374 family)
MKRYISLLILIVIFIFLGFYLNKNLGIILTTFGTTATNMTSFFFAAALMIALSFYFLAKSYQIIFKMNHISRTIFDLYRLNLTGIAVNVIIPTVGVSQMVVYVEDAHRRGESKAATVNAVLVKYISDYSSISIFLLFSLIYLSVIGSVSPHVVVTASIFMALTALVYGLSYLAGKESHGLERLVLFLTHMFEKIIGFITRKKVKVADSVHKLYKYFKDVNKSILDDPKDWIIAISYACLQHVFAILGLYLIFVSLGIHPLFRVLVAAYSVGEAIRVVSPTPSGIGFVEGGMFLVFTSLGISGPIATTATIIYRGLVFWIPLAVGLIFYQRQKLKDIFRIREK